MATRKHAKRRKANAKAFAASVKRGGKRKKTGVNTKRHAKKRKATQQKFWG